MRISGDVGRWTDHMLSLIHIYPDDGYVLPPLEVRWHEIPVQYGKAEEKDGQIGLFTDAAAGLKDCLLYTSRCV